MKTIGLVRHFRIPHGQYRRMDSVGFALWSEWYDNFDVPVPKGAKTFDNWDFCYSSDLSRARKTAETIYKGTIETTPLLREVPFAPLFSTRMRLPLLGWQVLSRVGWRFSHGSQGEFRQQTRDRIEKFFFELSRDHPHGKILLVSHGFLMQYLKKYLLAKGYKGHLSLRPVWGETYTFTAP